MFASHSVLAKQEKPLQRLMPQRENRSIGLEAQLSFLELRSNLSVNCCSTADKTELKAS